MRYLTFLAFIVSMVLIGFLFSKEFDSIGKLDWAQQAPKVYKNSNVAPEKVEKPIESKVVAKKRTKSAPVAAVKLAAKDIHSEKAHEIVEKVDNPPVVERVGWKKQEKQEFIAKQHKPAKAAQHKNLKKVPNPEFTMKVPLDRPELMDNGFARPDLEAVIIYTHKL